MAKKTTTTSKTVAAKKTTAKATASKNPVAKKAPAKKKEFTDEQIAMKAYEIYQARIAKGEHAHSDDDWHRAVEALRKGK